jgi:hypothetical protein
LAASNSNTPSANTASSMTLVGVLIDRRDSKNDACRNKRAAFNKNTRQNSDTIEPSCTCRDFFARCGRGPPLGRAFLDRRNPDPADRDCATHFPAFSRVRPTTSTGPTRGAETGSY